MSILISDGVSIDQNELTFTASRSGGPGGQNVNKVSSRVTLSFDLWRSPNLSEDQKHRAAARLATRINKNGLLRVVSQRTRSQEMNRADAITRFAELLRQALKVETPRIKTRVSAQIKRRRLEEKKKRSLIKQNRAGTEE